MGDKEVVTPSLIQSVQEHCFFPYQKGSRQQQFQRQNFLSLSLSLSLSAHNLRSNVDTMHSMDSSLKDQKHFWGLKQVAKV
jgi:hypothetical protein